MEAVEGGFDQGAGFGAEGQRVLGVEENDVQDADELAILEAAPLAAG
ncbi:MAG: hypothetical protein JSU00_30935 [Acidobacteria bacterium]|nr:hypothetical protein [Acidobacteriota bacterium]